MVVSNSAGSVTSGAATLTVTAPTGGASLNLLAGALGGRGYSDGPSPNRLESPRQLVADAAGSVYLVESENKVIKKISASGTVSTLAGVRDQAAYVNGTGADARFTLPRHPVLDSAGNLYVFDSCSVRKITPGGEVSTFAGSEFGNCLSGEVDGTGTAARFKDNSVGMTIDRSTGTIYVRGNTVVNQTSIQTLRRVTAAGVVSTVNLSPNIIVGPMAFAGGTIYGLENNGTKIFAINPNTGATSEITSFTLPFAADLTSLCSDGSGNLWATAGAFGNQLWRVPQTGGTPVRVIGVADNIAPDTGDPANVDGSATAARLFQPWGVACGATANKVFIADTDNHTVRVLDTTTNAVSTLAGTPIAQGAVDGGGGAARFRFPNQVVADSAGNWYVSDGENLVIRKITPAGDVTVLAGSFGNPGSADGTGTQARFSSSTDARSALAMAIDSDNNLYVADRGNSAIRKITPAGVVTTVASGSAVSPTSGAFVNADYQPSIAVDSVTGDIFFASKDGVRRWSKQTGQIALVIQRQSAIAAPYVVAVDSSRRKLFAADSGRVQRYGGLPGPNDLSFQNAQFEQSITDTVACLGFGQFCSSPQQMAVAPNGAVAIAYAAASVVRRINPAFAAIDTIAGSLRSFGVQTGALPARLNGPTGVSFNAAGQFAVVMGEAVDNLYSGWGEGAVLVTTGFVP